MKTYLPYFIKTRLWGIGLLAGVLVITLNSCYSGSQITYQQSYAPPVWAPQYDDAASVQYYYFPDYGMYYDVWGSQFWYNNNGVWLASASVPSIYGAVNLYNCNIVLINKQYTTPWVHHDYYARNYPAQGNDNYQNITVNNRVVRNTNPEHGFVPRTNNGHNNNPAQNNQPHTQDQQNDHTRADWNHTQQPAQSTQTPEVNQPPVTGSPQPGDNNGHSHDHSQQPSAQGTGQSQWNNQQPAQATQPPAVHQPAQGQVQPQPIGNGQSQWNRQPSQPTQPPVVHQPSTPRPSTQGNQWGGSKQPAQPAQIPAVRTAPFGGQPSSGGQNKGGQHNNINKPQQQPSQFPQTHRSS